jgi:hypothetical protein
MKRINWKLSPFKSGMVILAMACLLAAPNILADGDSHMASQGEKDFAKNVYATFQKALPPGPEGWEKTQATEVKELDRVFVTNGWPLPLDYSVSWQDSKRLQESRMKEAEEIQKLAKNPASINDNTTKEISKKCAAKDATLNIKLATNAHSMSIQKGFAAIAPVGGGQAFRKESEYGDSGSWTEGTTYVFLGKGWKLTGSGSSRYMESSAVKGAPVDAAQTIVVQIQADPERAKQVIAKIDWEALKKLIK